jgi:hypothetical protein
MTTKKAIDLIIACARPRGNTLIYSKQSTLDLISEQQKSIPTTEFQKKRGERKSVSTRYLMRQERDILTFVDVPPALGVFIFG